MGHDVFISYSSKDKPTADAVCVALEANGIRCWVAPRDILPGMDWGEAIIDAINECKIMVLVFSVNANESPQIKREVERVAHRGAPIIPFRIEDVNPSKSLEYFISTPHWLDALTPPMEKHLQHLVKTIKVLLHRTDGVDDQATGHREPPQLIPEAAMAADRYRTAVEVAWADKKIEAPEIESLNMLAGRIGISEKLAGDIELEIIGDTKEAIAGRSEPKKSSMVESLGMLAGKIGITEKPAGDIERAIGRDAKKIISKRNEQKNGTMEGDLSSGGGDDAPGTGTRFSFCRKCGERILPGTKFCRKCGEKLG